MPYIPQAPLALTAMTLRGVGSYLHGARLDIRPLTILCGANGSGKSTWLKALRVLKDSLEARRLPYGFSGTDSATEGIEYTNACYFLAPPDLQEQFDSEDQTTEYGPPGTIGLELLANREYWPSRSRDESLQGAARKTNRAYYFLRSGHCQQGMRFRVRIAHPGHEADSVDTPQLLDLVELQLNDDHVLRLEGAREPAQIPSALHHWPRRSTPLTLFCSPGLLWETAGQTDQLVEVGELTDINRRRWTNLHDGIDEGTATSLLQCLETRILEILEVALDGVFHIGAIRRPYELPALNSLSDSEVRRVERRRHVGNSGEHSWRLERAYGGNRMREITIERFYPDDIGPHAESVFDLLTEQDECPVDPRRQRILDFSSAHLRERAIAAAKELSAGSNPSRSSDEDAALIAELFNSVLDNREFYDERLWAQLYVENTDIQPDPEIKELSRTEVNALGSRELRRLNYLLICEAFHHTNDDLGFDAGFLANKETYPFVSYLSYWLRLLVNAGLEATLPAKWRTVQREAWEFVPSHPTGLLLEPDIPQYFGFDEPSAKLSRLVHPCFGHSNRDFPQPPRQLSAGFHQVFPIFVQLGMMKRGELLTIENPEVHLHPGLQLRLTEALSKHVPSGRRLLIETHSDLVVRRVLRAILAEEIAQSQVGIYFTDIAKEEHGYHYSTLTALEINDKGQIANWPEGFMDDDVKESRRLLDAMYGRGEPEDEEPEQ